MKYTIEDIAGMLLRIAPRAWEIESESDLKEKHREVIEALLDHAIYEEERRGKLLGELYRTKECMKAAGLLA